jgi:hypothetical protein
MGLFSEASLTVLPPEFFHSTGCIDYLLFTGKKGMTLGTDFHPDFFFSRTGFEGITAGTGNRTLNISRMNSFFHLHLLDFKIITDLAFFSKRPGNHS